MDTPTQGILLSPRSIKVILGVVAVALAASLVFMVSSVTTTKRAGASAGAIFLQTSNPTLAGDATASGYVGSVVVNNWDLQGASTFTMAGANGAVGKASFTPLQISRAVGKDSPVLANRLAVGSKFDSLTLSQTATTGNSNTVYNKLVITLSNVFVTKVSYSSDSSTSPMEQDEFSFTKIQETFRPVNTDGSLGTAVTSCFDLVLNRSC